MITDICSMYILLAAATTLEIQATIDFLEDTVSRPGGQETALLITGVGSVAATYALARRIGDRRPDLIIQAGIAGCFSQSKPGSTVSAGPTISAGAPTAAGAATAFGSTIPGTTVPDATVVTVRPTIPGATVTVGPTVAGSVVAIGSTVAVSEELLADLGVWEEGGFRTLFDLNLAGKDSPPFTGGALINPYQRILALSGLEQVRGITVNEITTSRQRLEWYQQNLQPVVESMEGGALHYVCLRENIPFIQIRSVSNDAGERDKTKWNIGAAIRQLNDELIALLTRLAAADGSVLEAG